ncbi:MAG TPA: hypothetical protein VMS18_20395 [Candidatus Binatia bacterium]|nr:hypothetical protein [Candidatus Binatia bacterium]
MKLGFENKKQTTWAIVLGVIALLVCAYELIPLIGGSSSSDSSAQAASPIVPRPATSKSGTKASAKAGKKSEGENLDPTLRLDLLASSEKTQYEGAGRNIFVSQREDVEIPKPVAPPVVDNSPPEYVEPKPTPPPPIPLKFYGFASAPGEPKKIFLKNGDDVFVAGEGEIVDRRYKVIRISTSSVEIQDMVYSGPPQMIALTQGG